MSFQQNNWAQWLPLVPYTHNSWPNATTKQAPFELIMGHIPCIHQPTRPSNSPTADQRLHHITEVRKQALDAIRRSQEHAEAATTKFTPYQVGEKVWLDARNLATHQPTPKLAPRRYGPFAVTKVISRTTFQLQLPPQWKIHPIFHASLLTPYKETREHGANFPEPPPDLIDGQPEWEIESILGVRKRRNQLQYLVRWKGFSEGHDSWEPLTHINADLLIERFHQKNPTAIRVLNKNPITTPQTSPILLHLTTMTTTPPPTISSPFREEYPPLPPSPPLSLEQRIEDAPPPLLLADRISEPGSDDDFRSLPPTSGQNTRVQSPCPGFDYNEPHPDNDIPLLAGYGYYDPLLENHAKYAQKIQINEEHVFLEAIRFEHNYVDHQHYVMGLHRSANPPDTPYGWPLYAAEDYHPARDPIVVDDHDLTPLRENHVERDLVDIGLYQLNDRGLITDVDRLRGLEEEHDRLTTQK